MAGGAEIHDLGHMAIGKCYRPLNPRHHGLKHIVPCGIAILSMGTGEHGRKNGEINRLSARGYPLANHKKIKDKVLML